MKVILLKDVKKQGKKNDIIDVKGGYGNFLINNKLAILATKGSTNVLNKQKEERILEENLLIKECESVKKEMEKLTLDFKVKCGKDGKVFGQISTKQISSKLKQLGFNVDKKQIKLDVPINNLGVTLVEVQLHKKVCASLKINLRGD